jgi:fused signal recognition particle receptor
MVLDFLKSGYQRVKNALLKTGSLLGNKIRSLFQGKVDEEVLERLEKVFYESDLGIETARQLTDKIKHLYAKNPHIDADAVLTAVKAELLAMLPSEHTRPVALQHPHIILIVGVNGNGKTTSTAKLAKKWSSEGKKVLLAAADTFRAAAIEQLELWAKQLDIDIVKGAPRSDPAAVAFDAMQAAKARNSDVVIIDTAGRLHTKVPLMQELEKIKRACRKFMPDSPHETLLVLDATTGQNGIEQAKVFHQYTPISGLILTKLDGSAKGGVAIAIQRKLGIPIKYIGVGESIDDLERFDPESYVSALLG